MKQEVEDRRHVLIEVPSTPSDTGMTIDAGGDLVSIAAGGDLMQISSRSDPSRTQDAQRVQHLEAELASLRNALLQEQVLNQIRSQEQNNSTREQARRALMY